MKQHALLILAVVGGAILVATALCAQSMPDGYTLYGVRCALIQQQIMGRAWSSVMLAQIEQESYWNPRAESPFAQGLTQFTPATREAVARKYGLTVDIMNAEDACRLQSYLVRDLARSLGPRFDNFYSQWAAVLRSYNGPPHLFLREWRAAGSPQNAFLVLPEHCVRVDWACKENTEYPIRILIRKWYRYYWIWEGR